MRPLQPLVAVPSYLERYVQIRNRKHHATRDLLIAAHKFVSDRYEELADAIDGGTLHQLAAQPQAPALKNALRACYDSPTKLLNKLTDDIDNAQDKQALKYCPLCGTTLPGGYDHYMPAEKFPEFAVNAINLVPCCAMCNSTKDDDWLDAAGNRQYIHFYIDQIPEVAFLRVEILQDPAIVGVGARFYLDQSGIDPSVWIVISSHFSRLRLIARYSDLVNSEIDTILDSCCDYLRADGPNVRTFITNSAATATKVHGRNHWRAVLMAAMANHADLEEWLTSKLQPKAA